MIQTFQALVVSEEKNGDIHREVRTRTLDDLPEGEVIIAVEYSSLNYKDALSAAGNHGVTRRYPHTPGIDAVGRVFFSTVDEFSPGDQVLCMGYDLGMNTAGGFGGYISVPAAWVMLLPQGISPLEAMQIGTAGFTAAQCIDRLCRLGLKKGDGPVLVTGATGGVGSLAVRLLSFLEFEVTALTGKPEQTAFLEEIGATHVMARKKLLRGRDKMLLRERWTGVVDTVGGEILATAVKATRYGGMVTCCGNASSGDLPLNVYPFILRGVTLAGIDSAICSMAQRKMIWEKLASVWRFPGLEKVSRTVTLDGLEKEIVGMLQGKARGRIVVDLREER
ncbi:MAG TPA: acryloyl-CoA reductase [Desulfobulbaceae bacterium]|nr:acryloyl-CoA reductase [Desulfobulbaceae bacterium]